MGTDSASASDSAFEDDDSYTGAPLTTEMIARAESRLGVTLPKSYLSLLADRNGGVPRRRRLPTPFATSWAQDHFEIAALRGLGGEWGIDSDSGLGSSDMIEEWDYPPIGIVLCDMPSGGHDAVMLDYSTCGPRGEPPVAYIDEDRLPRRIAETFTDFWQRLESAG